MPTCDLKMHKPLLPTFIRLGAEQVLADEPPIVAAIGNFDGLHVGHQRIMARVVEKAHALKGIPTVVTFCPLPVRVIAPQQPFYQLMSLSEKLCHLKAMGIEQVIGLRFNAALRQRTASDFLAQSLGRQLQIRAVVVGEDFRFGFQQQGDIALLQSWADQHQILCETVSVEGADKISSTHIRQALREGNVAQATQWLGRPYSMMGRVIHGQKRGRLMGIPTANIAVPSCRQGLKGTFMVKVTWRGKDYPGVANIGTRPTVDGRRRLLEAHLFDFSEHLYGERIHVHFIQKIRDEKRFDSMDQLRLQIEQDIAQGRAYFRAVLTEGDIQ